MKTACVAFASGCPRSKNDAYLLIEYFKKNGWKITTAFREADLILLGTCGFNKFNEEKSIEFLSIAFRKKRKDVRPIVFGCLPGINKEQILKKFDVETITPATLNKLDDIIKATIKLNQIPEPNFIDDYLEKYISTFSFLDRLLVKFQLSRKFKRKALIRTCLYKGRKVLLKHSEQLFNLRIAKGCLESCTFCAIKFATGLINSKAFEDVLAEFRSGLSQGYKVFPLIAEDVGAYGQDIGTNIAELLKMLFKHQENFQLLWSDFNPKWLIKYSSELIPLLAQNNNRIKYIGFPIQSGSEKIIQLMDRGYTVEDAKKCMLELQQASPKLRIITHVLIGFPGEKEKDFSETKQFLRTIRFDKIDVYKYDDRPNIQAAKLLEKVSENVKYKRIWQLHREFSKFTNLC